MATIWFKTYYNDIYDNCRDTAGDKVQDSFSRAECEVLLRLPACYSESGRAVPLVLSAHGAGGIVDKATDFKGGTKSAKYLLEAGYAVFDINGTRADGLSWGNRRYAEAVHHAYRYIIEKYNVETGMFLSGASMGGLSVLNFVQMYPGEARVIGLFYPRLNLNSVTVDGVEYHGSYTRPKVFPDGKKQSELFAEQYGFQDPEVYDADATAGLDPFTNHSWCIDGERYTTLPVPIKIWHGKDDKTVPHELSVEYVKALRRTGSYAELRLLDNTGHTRTEPMMRELLLWFDRFR